MDFLSDAVTAVLKVAGLVLLGTSILMGKQAITSWFLPLAAAAAAAGAAGRDGGIVGGLIFGAIAFVATAWMLKRLTRYVVRLIVKFSDWLDLHTVPAAAVVFQLAIIGVPAALAAHGLFILIFDHWLVTFTDGLSPTYNWISSAMLGFIFYGAFRDYVQGNSPYQPELDAPDFN